MNDSLDRLASALSDRYRIESELGAGGMATVYLAEDLKHHRKVAVKVLRPELAAILGAERFLKEIEVTANLQHPNILPLYDSGEADTFLYYVMPYIEGESLRDKLNREKQLGVEEAVEIAKSVAAALQFAHERAIIHRDIKPENILLQSGQALVADFGIALAVSHAGGTRLTETGLSLGTPQYMSPEQAMGDREVDARSDVYSLAAMLYEMLVGDPPYTGSTAQAIVAKVITEKAVPITMQRDTVPRHVAAAIHKALAKLPADRFPDVTSFAEAMARPSLADTEEYEILVSGATPQRPATAASGWRSYGFAAVAAVLGVLAVWGWLRAPVASSLPTRFAVPVPGGIDMTFWFQVPFALAPDGRTVVYSTGGQLHHRSFADFESTPIAGTEGAGTPFFSPDGQQVGFTVGAKELRRVSVSGGPVVTIANVGAELGASWGDNDEIVYAHSLGTKGLWRIPAGGGVPQPITTVIDSALETQHVWPQLLPGGDAVLFTVTGPSGSWSDAQVAIQDIDGGAHQTVIPQATFGRYVSAGYILYVREEGTVLAVPFDLRQRRVTGAEFPVLADVPVWVPGWASFTVSENGTLGFVRGTSTTSDLLKWVDRMGNDLGQIGTPVKGAYIRLSPDGKQLATEIRPPGNVDLWLLDAATGDRQRFTFEPEQDETPIWSSDGAQVAYSSAGVGDARRVFVKPVDRSTERHLLYTGLYHIHLTDWSPDDKWLAYYETHPQNGSDIRLLRADSVAEPLSVATTAANEENAVFSPNGRWLAYQSDDTGRPEVYVVSFSDLGSERQVSTNGGTFPRWAPDGDELFYLNGDTLTSSAVSTQAGDLTLGVPRPLFEYPDLFEYDVAPDGQRFVIRTTNPDAMAREIRVVLNWFEELKGTAGR